MIPNEYLRHTLATIAYRFQQSVGKATNDFGSFSLGHGTRSPAEIVHHMYRVLKASAEFVTSGRYSDENPENLSLYHEIERFNTGLSEFDNILAETHLESEFSKRLLQGPLADILTHIGQLSMMSRLNGYPIDGENFAKAPITIGKLSYF
jgi:hypothetical protein